MLRRDIHDRLKKWAQNPADNKCLLIRGARQVGKTFSALYLGDECFDSCINVNFLRTPSLKNVFSGDLDPDTLIRNFSLYLPNARFFPEKTLLVLDEIQECPEAITSLKFWAEDRRYKVLATGSMLGIDYKRPASYPVGSVEYLDMHALSFREFLYAAGIKDEIIKSLKECFDNCREVPDAIHSRISELLRLYMIIGGMPEVICLYYQNNSVASADEKQRSILMDYQYDIAHYASADIKIKAENCFLSIPQQLAKANHKFQYTLVEKGGNARKYASTLDWLSKADLISYCYNVSTMRMPLDHYADSTNFRIYPSDIGLLVGMYDYSLKSRLLQNLPDESRGGLYEALIADMLIKNGHKNLYFRKNEQSTFELEFLLPSENGVIPVEVKAGKSRSRSLDNALAKDEIPYGYKLTSGNMGRDGKKITMPHYMAMFL